SAQADRAVLDALAAAGASLRWEGGTLRVGQGDLEAFAFDATDCPDLFPPLAALACHARGTSRIAGVAALVSELAALGAAVRVRDGALEITRRPLEGGTVDPHEDHRMAMACAV